MKIAPIGSTGRPGKEGAAGQDGDVGAALEAGADVALLPQLSFSRYFPAERDRAALELGERMPAPSLRRLLGELEGGLVFAVVYECVGEGVFYSRGELIGPDTGGSLVWDRQRTIEAGAGRYEQMFISPGHGPRRVGSTPWGPAGLLIGADARDPAAYADLARQGARLVLGGVSDEADAWGETRLVGLAMSVAHGLAVAVVNRMPAEDEANFAGGSLVCGAGGIEAEPDGDGICEIEISEEEL